MGLLFEIIGISSPGRVNIKLDGRFQTINLESLPDDKLQQLYENGCHFIQPTTEGRKIIFPDEKPIEVTLRNFKIKAKKK